MYIYNQKEINKIVGGVTFYMGGVGSNSQICTFIKLFIWIYQNSRNVYSSICILDSIQFLIIMAIKFSLKIVILW